MSSKKIDVRLRNVDTLTIKSRDSPISASSPLSLPSIGEEASSEVKLSQINLFSKHIAFKG